MKVFNANNPDSAAIQRDDEDFFAKSGRQYRFRHPHQSELDLFAQQGGKMRNPWPAAIVKRLSAAEHEVIVFSMTDTIAHPLDPHRPSADPVDDWQRMPDSAVKKVFDLDLEMTARAAANPTGHPH